MDFYKDQDRLRVSKVLNQISAHIIPDGFGIPPGTPQQMLHAIGHHIAVDFRQLPAVFALHRAEQAADRGPGAATGFAARKV